MEVTATYLDWPAFSELAGDNFEDKYWEFAESDDGIPGELELDDTDLSYSFICWSAAGDLVSAGLESDSIWKQFALEAFTRIYDHPEPRNDLGCQVNPELFATIVSPETVKSVMEPLEGKSSPITESMFLNGSKIARGSLTNFDGFQAEFDRWHRVWQKAYARGLGIAYHIG